MPQVRRLFGGSFLSCAFFASRCVGNLAGGTLWVISTITLTHCSKNSLSHFPKSVIPGMCVLCIPTCRDFSRNLYSYNHFLTYSLTHSLFVLLPQAPPCMLLAGSRKSKNYISQTKYFQSLLFDVFRLV